MAAIDFPASPTNGQQFTGPGGVIWVYDGAKWVSGTLTTGIYAPITNDNGRNLIHNSMMNIWQRGTGTFSANGYTADRWCGAANTSTFGISRQPVGLGGLGGGDEEAAFVLTNTFTGTGGAADCAFLYQPIEGVRRLSNKTVTVSFWAAAAAGTPKLGVSLDQNFGAGGTGQINGVGQAVTLSTAYTRYSLAFAVPSIAGKTMGTAGTDYTELNFWYSSGATNNTRAGGIGVQGPNVTISIWGVQLEVGAVATPLQKLDPVSELQQCQRFYRIGSISLRGYNTAGAFLLMTYAFGTPMRSNAVTANVFNQGSSNAGTPTVGAVQADMIAASVPVTATGDAWANLTFSASADL